MPFALTVRQLGYGIARRFANLTFALCFLSLPALADPVVVVALGDSLTAGYGLPPDQGLVPQLQAWLDAQGAEVVIQNAGVSGDTTAGGLSRLDWATGPDADAVMVILGGNDMLRGIDPAEVRANLDGILKGAAAKGLPVLLVGLKAPLNYGPDYKADFDAIYPDLAAKYQTVFSESFFAVLLTDPAGMKPLLQADAIHPNAKGVAKVVQVLGPKLLELAARIGG